MKKDGKYFFAPDYEFSKLLLTDDPIEIAEVYRQRILGYYINPAKLLIKEDPSNVFAVGILCFLAIDAVAELESGNEDSGKRFKDWLKDNIVEFNNLEEGYLGRIYGQFRSGLVHHARITHGGYFTYEIDGVIEIAKTGIIAINPEKLIIRVERAFNDFINQEIKIQNNAENLRDLIIETFQIDLELLEKQIKCDNPDCTSGRDANTEEDCKYCDGTGIDPDHTYERELEMAEDAYLAGHLE